MDPEINQLTERIIGAGIEVHRELGPGLLESAYQCALAYELRLRGIVFEEQNSAPLPIKIWSSMTLTASTSSSPGSSLLN